MWALLWLGLAVGCGGESEQQGGNDEGSGQCSPLACGGDVVGTWEVEAMCIDLTSVEAIDEPACEDFVQGTQIDGEGTLVFTAEGMMTTNLTVQFTLEFMVSSACAQALGGPLSREFCDYFQSELDASPDYESVACSFSPAACTCTVTSYPSTSTQTSPYTLQGNQLVEEGSDPLDYCVERDVLTLGTIQPEGSMTITARRVP